MKKAFICLSFTSSQNQNIQNCIRNLTIEEKKQSIIYLITNAPNIFDEIPEENRIILNKVSTAKHAFVQFFFRINSISC